LARTVANFVRVQFLSKCDYVIYIPGGGRTPECGTHDQLMEMTGAEYATVINNSLSQQQQQQQQAKRLTAVPSAGQRPFAASEES